MTGRILVCAESQLTFVPKLDKAQLSRNEPSNTLGGGIVTHRAT
jgi:hypothetical protein